MKRDLLFHWDLAVLVGVKRKAGVSKIEAQLLSFTTLFSVTQQQYKLNCQITSLTSSPGRHICTRCFSQHCRRLQGCHWPSSDVQHKPGYNIECQHEMFLKRCYCIFKKGHSHH